MKKIIICFLFSFLFFSNYSFAEDCDFDADPLCEPGPDAPIDSGVGLLIGAAAFYTVKKIRNKKD